MEFNIDISCYLFGWYGMVHAIRIVRNINWCDFLSWMNEKGVTVCFYTLAIWRI